LKAGDRLDLKQSKSRKYRATVLNGVVVDAIQNWLAEHPDERPHAPLFLSQRVRAALTVSSLNHMVKDWCREAGLKGNYGSHSLRKTWGYHQRIQKDAPIPLLMEAYGHSTQAQTLDYLCIQRKEVEELYKLEI
ncbi:MAG: tyrosine-type recombinase/integrase, partial [Pseudomonadota bacterium]